MSLTRLAVRVATVQAILGRTYAGPAVHDSAIPAIDVLAKEQLFPFIAVYTDDSDFTAVEGRGLMSSTGKFSLVMEMGISAQMQFEVEGGRVQEAPGKPPTDAQMELLLDMMERQIKIALMDDGNPWGEMWRRLISSVHTIKSMRGADSLNGVRFAGRQLVIECEPYAEPPCGGVVGRLYTDFLAMLRANEDQGLLKLADIIEASLTTDPASVTWQVQLRTLGLTRNEADAMQITPGYEGLTGEESITEVTAQAQIAEP